MLRVDNDLAYVLHLRAFRENSAIVQCLSRQYGRVDLVVNGLRSRKSPKRAMLQIAQPLSLSYQINTSLGTCKHIEPKKSSVPLRPAHYFSVQYANELLLKVLPQQTPCEDIVRAYERMLAHLHADFPQQAVRGLEIALLDAFLSLPDLSHCDDEPLDATQHYHVHPEHGVSTSDNQSDTTGAHIQAFNTCLCGDMDEAHAKRAKVLTQQFLGLLVDPHSLKTKHIHRSLTHLSS